MRTLALIAAIVLAACTAESRAPTDTTGVTEVRESRGRASISPSSIDSIAFISSQQNTVTSAPESCRNGQFTGCPTLRYGDFIEGYSGGSFVGYVDGVKCTSSNTAVATLNSKCYATVIGPGTTTITVTYDHGRLSASTTLTAT